MHIGPLPVVLRNICDDGRSIDGIIAGLEAKNVAVLQKTLFTKNAEEMPPIGTSYNFLALVCAELPKLARKSADEVFSALSQECAGLRKPSLRSALLLMQRMTETRLFADIIVMNEPVLNPDSGHQVLISLGREYEDGQSWVAAVGSDCAFNHDSELIVFLGPES